MIEKEISYIYSYIRYAFFAVKEFKDDKFLLDISRRIKNSMPKFEFSSGKYDFLINNFIHKEMTMRNSSSYFEFEEIRNHIYLVINYYRMNINPELNNYEIILNELTKYAYNNFDKQSIKEGKCDEDLENVIPNLSNTFIPSDKLENVYVDITHICINNDEIIDDKTFLIDYITSYLKKYSMIFENVDINSLSIIIADDLVKLNIKIDDILSHHCDSLINKYIKEKRFNIRLRENFNKIQMEVSKYVTSHHSYMEIEGQTDNISTEIFELSKLLIENGFNEKDVETGKCNYIIERHLKLDCIERNSKIDNNISNKIILQTNNQVLTLENSEDYYIINTLIHLNIKYLLLSDVSNQKDICIRKIKIENTKEYVCRLEDNEYSMIINLFMKENHDIASN